MDMTRGIFEQEDYGKLALEKIRPQSPNFRLYCVGWIENGGPPETWEILEVTGAEFREAKTGRNKGKLTVLVKGTKRIAHIHRNELKKQPFQLTQAD